MMSKKNREGEFKRQMERQLKKGIPCDPRLVVEFGSKTVKKELKKDEKGVK